jgi:hypothetical protein
VNPGAVDVGAEPDGDGGMTMPTDSDCDGKITLYDPCDDGLDLASMNAMDAAKAVELCTVQDPKNPKKWGVRTAKWVLPDGAPLATLDPIYVPAYHLGHGILPAFGPNVKVQAGKRMLGLSSGTARQPTDSDYKDVGGYIKGYECGSPEGFPKESPACPGVTTGACMDAAALEVVIHTPSNALGFKFDFDFLTFEWPNYICSTFNDFFVANLSPIPKGQTDGNISFDSVGNPVSVNNAFLSVCGCDKGPPCTAGGKNFSCALGTAGLQGTGFDMASSKDDSKTKIHGSTYWLVSKAPVTPSSDITIRWSVYDSSDGLLDSTTLIDNWQWIATPGTTVATDPVPVPK